MQLKKIRKKHTINNKLWNVFKFRFYCGVTQFKTSVLADICIVREFIVSLPSLFFPFSNSFSSFLRIEGKGIKINEKLAWWKLIASFTLQHWFAFNAGILLYKIELTGGRQAWSFLYWIILKEISGSSQTPYALFPNHFRYFIVSL